MSAASSRSYLSDIVEQLKLVWPNNRTINIVCHGHSVPSGYFASAVVDTFNAYPHLMHRLLKDRFPLAVINVIVTAIGGEMSDSGSERFERDVLCHKPDVLTIDYGLNDRRISLEQAKTAWSSMIEESLERDIKIILITPTHDTSGIIDPNDENWISLRRNADQIRSLADQYSVGLVDSFAAFEKYTSQSGDLTDLLSWPNHPNRKGHEIVAQELLRWFPIFQFA